MVAAMSCEEEGVSLGRVGLMCQRQVGFSFSGTRVAEAQLQCDQTQRVVFLQRHLEITALFVRCKRQRECYSLHNLLIVKTTTEICVLRYVYTL